MILITGGAGFIGSNIARRLAGRGRAVAICDSLGDRGKWRNLHDVELARVIAPDALFDFLAERPAPIDALIHMGAITDTTETDADRIVAVNFDLSQRLWRWCSGNRVQFIYASSAATYGDGGAGFDDALSVAALACLRPLNAYGWSKHLFDRWVARQIGDATSPSGWAGLKFFNVYGPGEAHKGAMRSVVLNALEQCAADGPIRLFRSFDPRFADGKQTRDFVHVDDCVQVVEWLIDNPLNSGLFNVGSGRGRTFLDLATAAAAALEKPCRVEFFDAPAVVASQYQNFTQARLDRLRDAGYGAPFVGLEEGVAAYARAIDAARSAR